MTCDAVTGLQFEIGQTLRSMMELTIVGKVGSYENFSIDLFDTSVDNEISLEMFPETKVCFYWFFYRFIIHRCKIANILIYYICLFQTYYDIIAMFLLVFLSTELDGE